jgi:hypothetical protein
MFCHGFYLRCCLRGESKTHAKTNILSSILQHTNACRYYYVTPSELCFKCVFTAFFKRSSNKRLFNSSLKHSTTLHSTTLTLFTPPLHHSNTLHSTTLHSTTLHSNTHPLFTFPFFVQKKSNLLIRCHLFFTIFVRVACIFTIQK